MNTQNQSPARSSNLPVKIGVGVLVVVIFLAVVIYNRSGSNSNTNVATNTPTTNTATSSSTNASGFKDGTYSATGSYTTPGGREDLLVSLTLKDGKVADSTVTVEAKSPTSAQFQNEFIKNYKQFVTGKSISDLKLSKVSGSSLTGTGFNAAIEKIKADAKI